MPEHAIAIARVSSTKQDEEDQRPGLTKYAERKGYALDTIVAVSGRSAFHGRHVKHILTAVDTYVRNGHATVVIFRHVDRSSREGVFEGMRLMNHIMDAGARIEFSEQEFLNENPGWLGPMFEMAKKESEVKRDRSLQGNDKRRNNGRMIGRTPWGYDPVFGIGAQGKDVQVNIKPNAVGRKWVPVIFDSAINGKSLRAIAEMLRGVPSPQDNGLWNEATVRRLLARKTYYGAMRNNPYLEFEALISVDVWQRANAAVDSRNKRGRAVPVTVPDPALVRPICAACFGVKREGSPSGESPMYRAVSRQWAYYSCRGTGPARKSCGAPGVPVAALDELINEHMASDDRPRIVRVPIAGDDNDEQREVINQKIAAAAAAGDYALIAKLTEQAMTIGPSERKSRIEDRATGRTVGQHWQTLSASEKRDELTNWTVLAKMQDGEPKVSLTWRSPWEKATGNNGES